MEGLFAVLAWLWLAYKVLALVISLAAIAGIILISARNWGAYEPRDIRGALRAQDQPLPGAAEGARPLAREDWDRIMNRMAGEDPKNYLRAILEADGLCDYALKARGFPGETMGERMQAIPSGQFRSLEDFWRAHKVRNELAHDPNRSISPSEGDVMMRIYERVLGDLEAI